MALNQLIAQGVGAVLPPASNPQYMNALASMRNAEMARQSKMEELAFNRQKWEQEKEAARLAMEERNAAMMAAGQLQSNPELAPYLAAMGAPGKEAVNALLTGQTNALNREKFGFEREKFGAEAPTRAADVRSTVATAAGKELENQQAMRNAALFNVLQYDDPQAAMGALTEAVASGSVAMPDAKMLAARIGVSPNMGAVRTWFDQQALKPEQRLERKTSTIDLGGIVRQEERNPYGVGAPATSTDLSKTMTPDQVADNIRANITENRLQRAETDARLQSKITNDLNQAKFELERKKTEAAVAADKATKDKLSIEIKNLEAKNAETEQVQAIIQEPDFDMKNPASRQKLMGTDAGRAVVKSYNDTVKADVDRETSDITMQLKKQELTNKELDKFTKKLSMATNKDSLAAAFGAAINDPILGNEFGTPEDEKRLMQEIQTLQTPEQVKAFVEQVQGKLRSEEAKTATETNDVKNYKFARENGYTGSFIDYQQLGEQAKSDLTSEIKEYEYSVKQWEAGKAENPGSFDTWRLKGKKAGASNISQIVDASQEKKFEETLGTMQGKRIEKNQENALAAAEVIETGNIGRRLLDEGTIVGFGANFLTKTGEALHRLGFNVASDSVSNTRAYAATMGKSVASLIKQFGAGTGLSDADREFATKMAGGDISLDAKSLRRIIEINDSAARNVIRKYNKSVEGIDSVTPLTVDEPPKYERKKGAKPAASKPSGPAVGTVDGGYKFKGGDPGNPANWIKQ